MEPTQMPTETFETWLRRVGLRTQTDAAARAYWLGIQKEQ